MTTLTLVILIVVLAFIFDYFNGYNDAANSIATIVATRVLTPMQAVAWAAFFNFVAAFTLGTEVAQTIGSKLVNADLVNSYVILTGLVGAIFWVYLTSALGLPVSASHSLYGGYAGAALSHAFSAPYIENPLDAILWSGWIGPVLFIVLSPVLGMLLGILLMTIIYWAFRRATPRTMDTLFRRLQLVSAAAFSYSHGANDAQKTMGIITIALITGGFLETNVEGFAEVPVWVIFSAYGMIALGTMMGGWKVVHTMGSRITKLKPREGFAAETSGAISVLFATALGQPVSTTHTVAGSIAGVGLVKGIRAVRWQVFRKIFWAWVMTIPISAGVGALTYQLVRLVIPSVDQP